MGRSRIAIFVTLLVAGIALGTEPRPLQSNRTAPKPKALRPNPCLRAAAAAEARDQAMVKDAFVYLATPQPQVGRFLQRRVRDQERQTGVREDDIIVPRRTIEVPLVDLLVCPQAIVVRQLEPELRSIPIVQHLQAVITERRMKRKAVIQILAHFVSPQPLRGIVKLFGGRPSSITLPSPHYLENHNPMYFPEEPDFPLPRELAYQEEVRTRILPSIRLK